MGCGKPFEDWLRTGMMSGLIESATSRARQAIYGRNTKPDAYSIPIDHDTKRGCAKAGLSRPLWRRHEKGKDAVWGQAGCGRENGGQVTSRGKDIRSVFRLMACLLSCAVLSGCGNSADSGAGVDKKPATEQARQVRVSRIATSPAEGQVSYVGTLLAHRKTDVSCEIGGTIEGIHFERGDRVLKGQPLAEVSTSTILLEVRQAEAALDVGKSQLEKAERGSRPEEIRIAEAALDEARASLLEAGNHFHRIKGLFDLKAISQSQYDAAKRGVDTARARVESAGDQLALVRQGPRAEDRDAARAGLEQARATLALARDRLRKSRLLAPHDGVAAFRKVEEGELIAPGTPVTQVVDLDPMRVRIAVSENHIRYLESGKTLAVKLDAIPHETFMGVLSFLSPAADPPTRSYAMELTIQRTDPRMADGMTARVEIPITDAKRSVKIPSAWLAEADGNMGILVAEKGKAVFRQVKLGAYYDQRVEILSGLREGELVITTPSGLKGGDPISYGTP
jgi:multidrug efflux pump subunit AcrA (membrane-fusion protein)